MQTPNPTPLQSTTALFPGGRAADEAAIEQGLGPQPEAKEFLFSEPNASPGTQSALPPAPPLPGGDSIVLGGKSSSIEHRISNIETRITLKAVAQLSKLRLSLLVVFSGAIAFAIGKEGAVNVGELALFCFGGLFTTISANIVNQILEVVPDSQMIRTRQRPLPAGNISKRNAWLLVAVSGIIGLGSYVVFFNWFSALLGLISWVLYSFIYTPLKRISPVAVAVGAIPGAMPLLIGYAAATGSLNDEAILLFTLQFIWQFPHFWSIAWVLHEDYARGGFRMLPGPGGHKDASATWLMAVYTFLLIPGGWLPYLLGFAGMQSAIVATVAGLVFFYTALSLVRRRDNAAAKRLMFASFFYLPIQQIALLFDQL